MTLEGNAIFAEIDEKTEFDLEIFRSGSTHLEIFPELHQPNGVCKDVNKDLLLENIPTAASLNLPLAGSTFDNKESPPLAVKFKIDATKPDSSE